MDDVHIHFDLSIILVDRDGCQCSYMNACNYTVSTVLIVLFF